MEKMTTNEESFFNGDNQNVAKDSFEFWVKSENQIKTELSEGKTGKKESTFFDVKLSDEEIDQKLEVVSDVFISMAMGDFSRRLKVTLAKNIFSWLATNVNMISEELQRNVVKNNFLEQALELTSDMALITDAKGVIIFANDISCKYLNQDKDNIIRWGVANIFESKIQFGVAKKEGETIEDVEVIICPYNAASYSAKLTVKEVVGLDGIDGYLYRIHKVGECSC